MPDRSLLVMAQRAYQLAQRAMPDYASKFSKRTFTQPQLLTCLILKAYLRFTYREMEAWLVATDRVAHVLRLGRAPDHSTLCWFFQHKVEAPLLDRLLRLSLRPLGRESARQRVVALDSTGFTTDRCSRYYRWRRGSSRLRGWPKWALAVWLRPQLICAQRAHAGPCHDFDELPPLAHAAKQTLPYRRLLGDAGFDSESNHWYCREWLGVESIIAPFPRRGCPPRTRWRRLMSQNFPWRLYRQRWKVETVISVVKRKFGEILRSRTEPRQYRELLLLGIVYNVYRRAVRYFLALIVSPSCPTQ